MSWAAMTDGREEPYRRLSNALVSELFVAYGGARGRKQQDRPSMELIATAGYSSMMHSPNEFEPAQPPGYAGVVGRNPHTEPGASRAVATRIELPVQSADGLPIPQRYWGILTIALGLTMAVLDGAIANVALPTIAGDLNTSAANSIWVVNAYQLAVTISLLTL